MSTLTIRPPDDTAERLKTLARSRKLSVNKLIEELSIQTITAADGEVRFKALAARGDAGQALAILDNVIGHLQRHAGLTLHVTAQPDHSAG